MIYLDKNQVREMIHEAESEGQAISIRCIRKTEGFASNGTRKGELHTLICSTKPPYQSVSTTSASRYDEDMRTDNLTVWAINRKTGAKMGAWRRVNLKQVQEVRYKEHEYKVVHTY